MSERYEKARAGLAELLLGPAPRPIRFIVTGWLGILLASLILCVLVLLAWLTAHVSVTLSPLHPEHTRVLSELGALAYAVCNGVLCGLVLMWACQYVSSREWAVCGRWACLMTIVLITVREATMDFDPKASLGEVTFWAVVVPLACLGAFAGGYLGDRRRAKTQAERAGDPA